MSQNEEFNVGLVRVNDQIEVTEQGSVSQGTNITTGVTCNHSMGQITTVSSTLAAGAEAKFTVTNSKVKNAKSAVIVNIGTTTSAGTPVAFVTAVAAGSFDITLSNLHATDALNSTLKLNFLVINAYQS